MDENAMLVVHSTLGGARGTKCPLELRRRREFDDWDGHLTQMVRLSRFSQWEEREVEFVPMKKKSQLYLG